MTALQFKLELDVYFTEPIHNGNFPIKNYGFFRLNCILNRIFEHAFNQVK